ncbi:MAG: DUF3445 domain-containing protein [Rubrimonas sp.]|uniref:heme-dependent oxidative N-demethylase family protein n=1 Tax=Rubrimonas sp. TaxID=2036015 RepID=UPI002FDDC020
MSAPYTPFMDPRTARPPGVGPLDRAAWLCVDDDFAAQMAERDALFEAPDDDVACALPEGEAPTAELLALLLDWTARDGRWRREGGAVIRPDSVAVPLDASPLTVIGRLMQEDALLLIPGEPEYLLVAGTLCFPQRWALSEKLGRPLTDVHRPVPGYPETLAARINRMFAALRVEAPLMRINWLVHPTDTLRIVQREAQKGPPPDPGRGWHLRTERQCLLRLPQTRAVVFTIKTTVTHVDRLSAEHRAGLRDALAGWGPGEIAHRGGVPIWRAALDALA